MPATHTYDNGDKYEGGLLGGKRTGHGIYHDANGSVYTGTWSDDNLNGPGKYTGEDGSYDGEWKDSLKHGRGTFLWTNGDKYSGEWAEDSMNGRGEFNWTNGKVYVGQWCDGIRSGAGVLKFPNGAKYEGQWKNDKCHGKGRYIEDAGVYEGEWVENQKHGRGIFHYKDGRRYDGEWVRDKKTTGLVWTPDGIFKVTFNEAGAVVSQAEAKPEDLTPHLRATPKAAPKSSKEDEDIYGYCQRVGAGQAGDDDRPWTRRPQAGWDYSQKKSYAELKIPSIWNRPDIDAVNRERYLSDAEFEQVFQIPKAVYDLMPQWKKNSKKKQLKLFQKKNTAN